MLFLRVRQYPDPCKVWPVFNAYLTNNGYNLVVEKKNRVLRSSLPLANRLNDIKDYLVRRNGHRLDIGERRDRGELSGYETKNGGRVEVEMEISGHKTYLVIVSGDNKASWLFPGLRKSMNGFDIPIRFGGASFFL